MRRFVVVLLLVVVGGVVAIVVTRIDFCRGKDVTVFLEPDVAQQQRAAVRAEIAEVDADIEYFDQAEAYEEFKDMFRDSPDMVESIDPSDLPPSFRLTTDHDSARAVVRAVDDMPGVRNIFTAPCGKGDELRRRGPSGRG